ncbi:MAG TPA: AGE family epimerase/isomerase [Opitutaceae bacterium]|jgi:mannobiose 2-epimerase
MKVVSPACCLLLAFASVLTVARAANWPELGASADHELRGDILSFWLAHAQNPANQGFYGLVDEKLRPHADEPRGELLTARILWTFSRAYREYHDAQYLEMARYAYGDLTDHFTDHVHGGYFWTIDANGHPLDEQKLVYGQAFAIYALAEYYEATHTRAALRDATALFHLLDERAHDPDNGGYFDAYDRSWHRMPQNMLGPAPKTQNSTIHVLEAFTGLLRVWPDQLLQARERELIRLLTDRIVDSKTHHLILYLTPDWKPLSDQISYGHDIELSWLITEAADVLGDPVLQAGTQKTAIEIADATLAQGVNADGGVMNLASPSGVVDGDRDWWNQAEAVTGFLNAYQITHDPKFAAAALKTWHFIETSVVDHRQGEWFRSVKPDGSPAPGDPKISLWKCPYHNSRACFQIIERCHELEK